MENVIDRISELSQTVPKKQKMLCLYLIENQARVGMMPIAELAQNAGVGTTTVLRLSEQLGFSSFTEFKHAMMEESITRAGSSYSRMISSFTGGHSGSALSSLCAESVPGLSGLSSPQTEEEFQKAVKMLLEASRINIIGMRSSVAFAAYLVNGLSTFMPNVRNLSDQQEYLSDRIFAMEKDEVLVAVSVWPCTRRTVNAAELAASQGIPVVLLTNTKVNPIARVAQVVLDTNSINQNCTDVLMMAFCNALVQELGSRTAPRSTEALARLERKLDENGIILWRRDT